MKVIAGWASASTLQILLNFHFWCQGKIGPVKLFLPEILDLRFLVIRKSGCGGIDIYNEIMN